MNRVGKYFALTVIALFGLMCLLGFFQRLPRPGGEEWGFGVAAVALFGFDFLLWRFFRRPRLILSDSSITESRLFGSREHRYADLDALSGYVEKLYPRGPNGTASVPLFLHRLIIRTRDGRECRITLPAFGYNGAVIEAIESRSGRKVERLPDRESQR